MVPQKFAEDDFLTVSHPAGFYDKRFTRLVGTRTCLPVTNRLLPLQPALRLSHALCPPVISAASPLLAPQPPEKPQASPFSTPLFQFSFEAETNRTEFCHVAYTDLVAPEL